MSTPTQTSHDIDWLDNPPFYTALPDGVQRQVASVQRAGLNAQRSTEDFENTHARAEGVAGKALGLPHNTRLWDEYRVNWQYNHDHAERNVQQFGALADKCAEALKEIGMHGVPFEKETGFDRWCGEVQGLAESYARRCEVRKPKVGDCYRRLGDLRY